MCAVLASDTIRFETRRQLRTTTKYVEFRVIAENITAVNLIVLDLIN